MDITTTRIVPAVQSLSSAPKTTDGKRVIVSALLLTGLLVGVVPTVAVSTGVPLLALVGIAGVVYAAGLVLMDSVFEGLCGGLFVLCTFGANVPVLRVPFGGSFVSTLSIMFVDVVAVPLAILFVFWRVGWVPAAEFRAETVAGYALAGLAVWATLAAVFGHGPSRSAALFFAIGQFRYLLLFVVGATVVRYVGVRSAVYSLMIGIFGNVAFMFAETLNRGSFGLSYLGEATKPVLGAFFIGPIAVQTSMYSGFTGGSSRVLVTMALLVLPVAVMGLVTGSYWQKALGAVCLLVSVFLVRISNSDAAFAALLVTIALVFISMIYISIINDKTVRNGLVDFVFGYLGIVGAGALTYLLFSQRAVQRAVATGTAGTGGSGDGGATSSAQTLTETILSIANRIPFIDTTHLSIRIHEYVAAVVVGLQYPLFGLGGSNFTAVSESYGLPGVYAIHNTLLGYLAATGIPGVVLLVVAIVATLVVAIKQAVDNDSGERLFWVMVVCGMLGFHAMTFWISAHRIQTTYMTFWVFAGAVVGSRY